MTRVSTSAALFAATAELLLIRCTSGPVPLAEALVSVAVWLGLGWVAARLGPAFEAAPVLAWVVGLPIWRDGGPADASGPTWLAVTVLLVAGVGLARRGPVVWGLLVLASVGTTTLLTHAHLPLTTWALLAGALALLVLLRSRPLLAWALALLLGQVPGSPPGLNTPPPLPEQASNGPDIVLIVVDTLRADVGRAMHSYARLAEGGRSFERATASGPWTLPSMASLHIAEPVPVHGSGMGTDGAARGLPAQLPTVAERLADAGYLTAAVLAPNPWLGRAFGFDRGFAFWQHLGEPQPSALPANPSVPGAKPLPVLGWHSLRGLLGRPAAAGRADVLVDRAIELLATPRDRPLFLWLHLLDPHLPWTDLPGVDVNALRTDPGWRTPAGLERARAAYEAEVRRADLAVSRLLDALDPPPERGRLVLLTSDHGEEFLEHGGFEHGHTLYQELLDIPLVMQGAGVVPGNEPAAVGLDRVGATLLAAAGLPSSDDLRKPAAPLPVASANLLTVHPGEGLAVRLGDIKHIRLPDGELRFDLAQDPDERRPSPAAMPHEPVVPPASSGAPPLDAHTRRLLEQLGYLDR